MCGGRFGRRSFLLQNKKIYSIINYKMKGEDNNAD